MRRFLKVLNLTCFCIPLLFVQCYHSQNAGNCEKYLELAQAGQNYMYKSRFELNPSFLDSALMCFNEAEQLCPNKKSVMSYNKSFAYFDKKDYGNAVKMLELSADSLFFYPEYKTVLIERILAKSAGEQGDSIEQKRHYKTVVANLDHYITSFRMEADSIMKLSDWNNIPLTSYAFVIAERYCDQAKIAGKQKTLSELDALQKATGYNQDFINWVKDVVSGDKGQSIQILFD
jgi:tetratricopeptide (TPR) repeat protein